MLLLLMVSLKLEGQFFTEIGREYLLEVTAQESDTTYVINFWATWCSPCVKEIGYFEELFLAHQESKVKVILISLDFQDRVDRQLLPFLKERSITAPVMLMTDLDYNSWIDQVDPSWSGAIPATLIYNREHRIFLEQELSREALFEYVNQISN
ncbi:MAG: TlpA disulfide reductase family protein [Bacteroidales bacterium]